MTKPFSLVAARSLFPMLLADSLGLGFWNAWLYMVVFVSLMFVPDLAILMRKARDSADSVAGSLFPPSGQAERRPDLAWKAFFGVALVYSVFLPLAPGSGSGPWRVVVGIGLSLLLAGILLWLWVIRTIIASPPGRAFTIGPYRYSRHPMYVAQGLFLLGVATSTVSLVFLSISLVLIVLSMALALDEEASCLSYFGDEYREYMATTPRWL